MIVTGVVTATEGSTGAPSSQIVARCYRPTGSREAEVVKSRFGKIGIALLLIGIGMVGADALLIAPPGHG